MSYQVLARKYRSATFDELVGQEPIVTTLKNAVLTDRVHHGYLFTGTRGVGKTSAARILAKALNCLSSDKPTVTPCLKCDACVNIAEGEDVDVVEIDAASNTGVDNIRELRDNTAYRPTRCRFKVYIIDEVHMLSTQAFNGLLKTLEEPPGHVKFILATTELHKVPATIQSRCQRFDFRALPPARIIEQIHTILAAEGISAEDEVVRRISRLAAGSMRDALSLLDKVLSFGTDRLTRDLLDQLLPPALDEQSFEVVARMATGDAAGALLKTDEALAGGQTLDRFCDLLIDHVRKLMILRICGKDSDLVDVPEHLRERLAAQAAHYPAPTYVYMLTLLEEVRRAVRNFGAGRALLDAAVVRLTLAREFTDIRGLLSSGGVIQSAEKKTPDECGMTSPVTRRPAGGRSAAPNIALPPSGPSNTPASEAPLARPAPSVSSALAPGPGAVPATSTPPSAAPAQSTDEDRQRIMTDPLVREAMARFDAHLVDIRPVQRVNETMPSDAVPPLQGFENVADVSGGDSPAMTNLEDEEFDSMLDSQEQD